MRYVPSDDMKSLVSQLDKILNGGITVEDNIDGAFISVTTTAAATTASGQEITHGLGRIPNGFIVLMLQQEVGADPIISCWGARVSEWTKEKLYLRSNVANLTARLLVL